MSNSPSEPNLPTEANTRATRRRFLAGAAGLGAGLALTAVPLSAADAAPATADPKPVRAKGAFVKTKDGQFTIAGTPFRFGGTNTYYLHQRSHYMIDAALNDAAAMSLSVVRAWAFADGAGQSYTALQPHPYEYDEAAFDSLDYAVFKAGQLGLRLVLTLTNNWPDYGGMSQYVTWFLGLPVDVYDTAVNHDKFYTDKAIRNCYKAYARHVIQRRNPYTGLRYNEDPTIMTFELANEPRNRSDKSGTAVLNWAGEMSAYVKSLAPRQLVALGDEGFYGNAANSDYPYSNYEGMHWKKLVSLPHIDYGTVHVYPGSWGETPQAKPGTDPVVWGTTWINDHLRDGKRLGKPVVIEEYGLQVNPDQGIADEAARDLGYQAWTAAVQARGAGDQFWLLTSRVDDGSYYPDYDGFRIVWDNDPTNPTNSTAQLLSAHAKAMTAST